MSTATGVVKWFNNAKGYGFVTPDQGEQDIFIHFSAIAMEGYKTLKEGQKVEFELQEGPKGLHAANLQAATQPTQPTVDLVKIHEIQTRRIRFRRASSFWLKSVQKLFLTIPQFRRFSTIKQRPLSASAFFRRCRFFAVARIVR